MGDDEVGSVRLAMGAVSSQGTGAGISLSAEPFGEAQVSFIHHTSIHRGDANVGIFAEGGDHRLGPSQSLS